MVKLPWRRLVNVARWNTLPALKYTSVVAANAAHCQLANCIAGIMETSITGSDTIADHTVVVKRGSVVGALLASSSRGSLSSTTNAS